MTRVFKEPGNGLIMQGGLQDEDDCRGGPRSSDMKRLARQHDRF